MSTSHTVQVSELTSSLSESAAPSHTSHTTNHDNTDHQQADGTIVGCQLSPLMVYQASLILYELSRRIDGAHSNNNNHQSPQPIQQLRNHFSSVLSTASDEHLTRVVIKDITTAFLQVSQSHRNQTLTPPTNNNDSSSSNIDDNDVLMALRSLSGLIVHSHHPRISQLVFQPVLCTELALLYHYSILQLHYCSAQPSSSSQQTPPFHHPNHTNGPNDTVPACILSILSTLLIHGLILPQPPPPPSSSTTQPYNDNDANLPQDDHTLHTIMDVFQTLASVALPTQSNHTNTPSMVGCCLGDLRDYHLSSSHHTTTNPHHTNIHTIPQAIEYLFQQQHPNDAFDTTQKEYLIQILQSCPQSQTLFHPTTDDPRPNSSNTDTVTPSSHHHHQHQHPTSSSSGSGGGALDKRIQTIKSVFPNLGEGFIEIALACYNHDTETTISALIDAEDDPQSLHPRLRVLDRSLPARKRESKSRYEVLNHKQQQQQQQQQKQNNNDNNTFQHKTTNDREVQEEQEAYEIQKRHLREMNQREENLAIQLDIAMRIDEGGGGGSGDEYDDDYDDQYDGIGDDGGGGGGGGGGVGKIGRADGGGGAYDVDLNAIRAYNKVAREMEEDRIFWEESKNTNRTKGGKAEAVVVVANGDGGGDAKKEYQQNPKQDDENNGEANGKKYRGPDKGKKGRLIGPDGKYLPIAKGRKKNMHSVNVNDTNAKDTKGGGKPGTNAPGQTTTGLTKIQKRRKNNNKAKLGNHHRKERAMKKAGM